MQYKVLMNNCLQAASQWCNWYYLTEWSCLTINSLLTVIYFSGTVHKFSLSGRKYVGHSCGMDKICLKYVYSLYSIRSDRVGLSVAQSPVRMPWLTSSSSRCLSATDVKPQHAFRAWISFQQHWIYTGIQYTEYVRTKDAEALALADMSKQRNAECFDCWSKETLNCLISNLTPSQAPESDPHHQAINQQ